MKYLLVALLLLSIALSGCSNVRTYTFKKDRVDQRMEGNRGFLQGTPPPAPVRDVPKRTMFGVDVEIGLLPYEKAQLPPQKATPQEEGSPEMVVVEEEIVVEETVEPEVTNFEPKKASPPAQPEKEIIVLDGEEYVK